MSSFAKQGLAALSVCAVVFGAMYFSVFVDTKTTKQDGKVALVPPPIQYPYVDQIKMELILPAGETFVSVIPIGGGFFQLTTEVDKGGIQKKVFKVYTGLMGDRYTVIQQPQYWYTVKEQ